MNYYDENYEKVQRCTLRILIEINNILCEYEIVQMIRRKKRCKDYYQKIIEMAVITISLRVCKLLEERGSASIYSIIKMINGSSIPNELNAVLQELKPLYDKLRKYRNKSLAHMDHEMISPDNLNPYPEIEGSYFMHIKVLKKVFLKYVEESLNTHLYENDHYKRIVKQGKIRNNIFYKTKRIDMT